MKYKRALKSIMPPLLLEIRKAILNRNAYPLISKSQWEKLCSEGLIDDGLKEQVEEYLESVDFNETSKYWKYLTLKNLREIGTFGVDAFAENVARNYFTWTNFDDSHIENLEFENYNFNSIDIFKLHDGFTLTESIRHNVLIHMLLSHCIQNNLSQQISQLGDKGYIFGNHPRHEHNGETITLDKLASVIDWVSIAPFLRVDSIVCEIGAGSGRTAEALLTLSPNSHYIVADLPPASFIAMKRLQVAFPEKKIRYISNRSDLISTFTTLPNWDVIFCLPHLLEDLPNKSIDVMVAIDCLHEMSDYSREFFAKIASEKAELYFMKIWKETKIPLDDIYLDANNLSDYFVRRSWTLLKRNVSTFPGNFVEMIYRT